jgi:hypothetical protein
MQTPQREDWNGHPAELGDAWILRKGNKVARCVLVTHPLGWELRLMTPDLLRSHVCRSSEEMALSEQLIAVGPATAAASQRRK